MSVCVRSLCFGGGERKKERSDRGREDEDLPGSKNMHQHIRCRGSWQMLLASSLGMVVGPQNKKLVPKLSHSNLQDEEWWIGLNEY